MLTIREIKQRTESFFAEKGVPNPKLDADLLIAHSLGIKRLEIYLEMERPLTEPELNKLRPLVQRRAKREPLQYITGSVEFAGMELRVDARALIPRPETEEFFELVCHKMSKLPESILDLGTGTGALAIALASKFPIAAVNAVDLSPEALSLAKENAETTGFEERINFFESSWYESIPEDEQYDLIIANPPYLTEKEMTTAEPEVGTYEPHIALVSGFDGLKDLRIIITEAPEYLRPGGILALETGISQKAELNQLAKSAGFTGECLQDLRGHTRFYFCK